ncbi:hypothetical protein FKM82_008684 [Ascaphus truei]
MYAPSHLPSCALSVRWRGFFSPDLPQFSSQETLIHDPQKLTTTESSLSSKLLLILLVEDYRFNFLSSTNKIRCIKQSSHVIVL